MHFPRYWARGQEGAIVCWRWSDSSEAEAARQAEAAARRAAAAFTRSEPVDRYGYGERPLREPVLEEIRNPAGELTAAITCNAYGATVLSAAGAMFVDIDLPEEQETKRGPGLFARLFGPPPRAFAAAPLSEPRSTAEGAVMARVARWTSERPGWGWRAYRTAAGVRLLATHGCFEPDSAETAAVFEALGADPLYRRLCRAQKSFRARLSPKPWRLRRNPGRPPCWPWADERAARAFDRWHTAYAEAAREFATCALIGTIGMGDVHPDLLGLVRLHDQHARVGANLPLA
jgi:hypothetical protein